MARSKKIQLDHKGIAQILKSEEVKAEVHAMAEDLANDVRSHRTVVRHHVPVVVRDFTTDRAVSSVVIEHPAGLAMQAKYGVLTKALSVSVRSARREKARVAARARKAKKKAQGEALTGFLTGTRR